MYLKQLQLKHFRNYQHQQVEFLAPKTILVGSNAQGKSNLLEAVELLATLGSHRTSRDRDLIASGQETALVQVNLERDSGPLDLGVTLRYNGRRTLMVNSVNVPRQLDFLGNLNAVEFSSLDLDLVRGSPGERRQWLDGVLVQLEPIYHHLLGQYQQILKQRNALLRQLQTGQVPDPTQRQLWDQQLAAAGVRLTRRRRRILERLAPLAQHWHQQISGCREQLWVRYAANVNLESDDPETLLAAFAVQVQQKALAEQHQGQSLVGPHRDEVELLIDEIPARQYGSQGQQRTLVLALKLAELQLIAEVIGEPPLLLLDDVLAELDLERQNQLLEAIQERFQTLITTTHLGSFDAQWLRSAQVLTVNAGQITPLG